MGPTLPQRCKTCITTNALLSLRSNCAPRFGRAWPAKRRGTAGRNRFCRNVERIFAEGAYSCGL